MSTPAHATRRPLLNALLLLVLAGGSAGCELLTDPDFDAVAFTLVSAGGHHTCAAADDGQVFCWGERTFHQLGPVSGDGCADELCVLPAPMDEIGPVAHLAAATAHTCALVDGEAVCWGSDRYGELGVGDHVVTPCPTFQHLRCSPGPLPVVLGFPLTDLGASRFHTCAVTSAGRAYCWGRGGSGELGHGQQEGSAVAVRVSSAEHFVHAAVGNSHSCALTDDGQAFCWGAGSAGQLGTGGTAGSSTPVAVAGGHTFTALAAGAFHTCGVREDGVLLCWGMAAQGRLGTGDLVDRRAPAVIPLPEAAVALDGGWAHTCAITASGSLHCWGWNEFGQAGRPGWGTELSPGPVALPAPAARVSAGETHTCAVTTDGGLYCWGANYFGQLGNGSGRNSAVPVHLGGPAA